MKKLLIIDFFNLMHRAFHAYPKDFKTSKGIPTNAVYGFTNLLLTYLIKIKPTHVVIAYEDDEAPRLRNEEYAEYKANRTWAEKHPEEAELFYKQVPYALEILDSLGIKYIKCNGYEADDVIGTLANKLPKDTEIIILSNDQDFLQLTEFLNVKVLRPARPPYVKETLFDKKEVIKKFGFEPSKIPDYKGLRGDPSDNIPGVPGIGDKTAKNLLKKFNSIEDIYKNLDKVEPKRIKTLLEKNKDSALLSKKLAEIDINCPINIDLDKYKINKLNTKKAKKIFEELEFKSLLKKLDKIDGVENKGESKEVEETKQPVLFS